MQTSSRNVLVLIALAATGCFAGTDPGDTHLEHSEMAFTPPLDSYKGSVLAMPDGSRWVARRGNASLELVELGAEAQRARASIAITPAFRPDSVRLGIIAILIGLVRTPVPSLAFQDGDVLYRYAFDGEALVLVASQTLPAGASGFIAEDGTSVMQNESKK